MEIDLRREEDKLKHKGRRYRVIADGKEMRDVFYYNDETNQIGVHLRDASGKFYLTPDRELASEFIHVKSLKLEAIEGVRHGKNIQN